MTSVGYALLTLAIFIYVCLLTARIVQWAWDKYKAYRLAKWRRL